MSDAERIKKLKEAMASAIECQDIKAARVILLNAIEMDEEAERADR